MSKALPKLIQITNRCSHSPLWLNTTGLCEVKSRIYAANRWKCYPDYFPDPLALRELVEGTRTCLNHSNTPEIRHVAICGECRREVFVLRQHLNLNEHVGQRGLCCLWSLDSLLGDGDEDRRMKAWIWICSTQSCGFWRSVLQRTNTIVSCRNYVAVLVYFIVLLSVTACRRKRFFWHMENITSKG